MQSEYYDELARNSQTALIKADIPKLCLDFNRVLNSLDPASYEEFSSWVYALASIHANRTGDDVSLLPYSPKHIETSPGVYFISWNLDRIPSSVLRGVFVGFMTDFLSGK